jgi:hypothetical protein
MTELFHILSQKQTRLAREIETIERVYMENFITEPSGREKKVKMF